MRVFTYFEPVTGISVHSQRRELSVWKASWERFGWRPVILTHETVRQWPLWQELVGRALTYPSVNLVGYDLACYLRWAALAAVGGGLMTDYDVVNVGLTPKALQGLPTSADPACLCSGGVPAAVYARPKGIVRMLRDLMAGPVHEHQEHGRTHVSDMIIFQQRETFGHGAWNLMCQEAHETRLSPLVHCSHHSLGRCGVTTSRWEFMEAWHKGHAMAPLDPRPEDEDFCDLTSEAGAPGREDTQGCWQDLAGVALQGFRVESALDVGAGLGASRARLAKYVAHVTTQDLGPGLGADLCVPVDRLPPKSIEAVTAFDVLEHVRHDEDFLSHLGRVARRFVVVTTPNWLVTGNRHKYHYRERTAAEAVRLVEARVGRVVRAWAMFTDHGAEVLPEDLLGDAGLDCGSLMLMARAER